MDSYAQSIDAAEAAAELALDAPAARMFQIRAAAVSWGAERTVGGDPAQDEGVNGKVTSRGNGR